jgi:hypothetical protein
LYHWSLAQARGCEEGWVDFCGAAADLQISFVVS